MIVQFLLMLLAVATPTRTATPTATQTPPMLVYTTPGPSPTPIGSLLLSGTPTHGVPLTVNEQEAYVPIYVNNFLQGYTNKAGSFTITFPSAGTYTLDVGNYPEQTITVQ